MKKLFSIILLALIIAVFGGYTMAGAAAIPSFAGEIVLAQTGLSGVSEVLAKQADVGDYSYKLLEITHNGQPLSTDKNQPTLIQNQAWLTVRGQNVANKTVDVQYIVNGAWTRTGVVAEFDSNGIFDLISSPFYYDTVDQYGVVNQGDPAGTVKSFALAIMDTSTEQIFSQTPTYYLEYAGEDSNIVADINEFIKSIVVTKTELKITLCEGWVFDGGDFYLQRGSETINCSTWADDNNLSMGGAQYGLDNYYLTYKMPYDLTENAVYKIIIPMHIAVHKEGNDYYYNEKVALDVTVQPSAATTAVTAAFPDLPRSHWAYENIMLLVEKGVITGYEDGAFRPNGPVTRSEFAKMMTLALGIPLLTNPAPSFVDVGAGDWELIYVETAKKYLTGYQQGDNYYFKGKEPAVREDMAVALVKALKLEAEATDESNAATAYAKLQEIFSDAATVSPNLRPYVMVAYQQKLINGYPDGTFGAQRSITRAETAALLVKVLGSEAMKKVTFE